MLKKLVGFLLFSFLGQSYESLVWLSWKRNEGIRLALILNIFRFKIFLQASEMCSLCKRQKFVVSIIEILTVSSKIVVVVIITIIINPDLLIKRKERMLLWERKASITHLRWI